MTNKITATARFANGQSFRVEIANVTDRSAFLMTRERLAFRDTLKVTFDSMELVGEVVYVAQEEPRGGVVVFDAPPQVAARLKSLISKAEVLTASAPDELWADATEPAPADTPTDVPTASAIEAGLLQAALLDHSTTSKTLDGVLDEETDEHDEDAFYYGSNPSVSVSVQVEHEDTAAGGQLPELGADGILAFASAEDYRAQYASDIMNGGLIVRSPPLPIGAQKMIRLRIPGAQETLAVSARVGFVGNGTVGLMIDSFAKHKHAFERLYEKLE
jgi:hypothetical protein